MRKKAVLLQEQDCFFHVRVPVFISVFFIIVGCAPQDTRP